MNIKQTGNTLKKFARRLGTILATLGMMLGLNNWVYAATLTGASLALSDPRPSTSSSYTFDADNVTTSSIKCIKFDFGTASDGTGDAGLTVASATYDTAASDYVPDAQTWTVTPTEGTDIITLTQATGETPASATDRTVELDSITNGSTAEVGYFLVFNTYDNVDCSTSPVDSSTVQFIYTNPQTVSLTVGAALTFTVTGKSSGSTCDQGGDTITADVTTTATTVPFGTVTSSANKIGLQDLTVSTNSSNGYTTYTRYTAQPTSGSNTVNDHTGTNAAPSNFSAAGTEAFGYATNDATLGTGTAGRFTDGAGTEWAAFTTSNAEVAYSATSVSGQVTCQGYQVGISGTTESGTYTTTVIHTTTPLY